MVLALIVLAVFVISKDRNGTGLLLETGLFIIGARKIDYKKILKVYLAIEIPLTLITLMAARLGIIENLVYHRGEQVRIDLWICISYKFCVASYVYNCCMDCNKKR